MHKGWSLQFFLLDHVLDSSRLWIQVQLDLEGMSSDSVLCIGQAQLFDLNWSLLYWFLANTFRVIVSRDSTWWNDSSLDGLRHLVTSTRQKILVRCNHTDTGQISLTYFLWASYNRGDESRWPLVNLRTAQMLLVFDDLRFSCVVIRLSHVYWNK